MPKKKKDILKDCDKYLDEMLHELTPMAIGVLFDDLGNAERSIKRMRVAIWALTFGFSVLAISIILLVYGNPYLV